MPVRLQKYMADCGIASRRKSEELISEGKVEVNGVAVRTPGIIIDESSDDIRYNGIPVKPTENKTYVMLHKPVNCITTAKDQFGRRTVMDYIGDVKARVVPVGRLDYDTSGLLLLTDDGELLYRLTHPSREIMKTYVVAVVGLPTDYDLRRLRQGVVIDGRKTSKAEVKILEPGQRQSVLEITICEGRNRQVRKMCENVGHKVITLKRIKIGELSLGDLKKGAHRLLTRNEIDGLKALTGMVKAGKK